MEIYIMICLTCFFLATLSIQSKEILSLMLFWEKIDNVHFTVILIRFFYDLYLQVKPCINQVNLESCCVMPKDLTEYAKENDIQLLTHNDPRG